jgi:hypothetical protein
VVKDNNGEGYYYTACILAKFGKKSSVIDLEEFQVLSISILDDEKSAEKYSGGVYRLKFKLKELRE